MRVMTNILREAYGLVIDDGTLAVATVGWIAVVWASVELLVVPPAWGGAILFAGVAIILVENVARRSRR